MNKVIILLLLSSLSSVAESGLSHSESDKIRKNLIITLEKVKKFKREKNSQINQLKRELSLTKSKFAEYRSEKNKEINALHVKLKETKQALSQSEKALKIARAKAKREADERMEIAMAEPLNLSIDRTYSREEFNNNDGEVTFWAEEVLEDDLSMNSDIPIIIPISETFEDQSIVFYSQ